MILKRLSTTALRSSDSQALKLQSLRSGQCVRCFHASLQMSAEKGASANGNDRASPANGSPRGQSRKQRATAISNEVSALQQTPAPPAARTAHAPRRNNQSGEYSREHDTQLSRSVVTEASGERANAIGRPQQNVSIKETLGIPYKPLPASRESLLNSGEGSATIANGGFEGVFQAQLNAVVEHGHLAHRAEGSRKRGASESEDASEEEVMEGVEEKFQRIPAEVEKAMTERIVKGVYDADGLLDGEKKYAQPTLNEVAKQLLKNGTFLSKDRSQLLRKVQSLLPSAVAAGKKASQKAT